MQDGEELLLEVLATSLVLVHDSLQLPAQFLVQSLLKGALQSGHRVVLLPVKQSLQAYKYVLRKMGVQLQSFLDSGHVTVVPPPAPQVRPVSSSSWGTADCSVLQDLTRRLHSAVAQQCSKAAADAARAVGAQQQRVLVVVDSLSDLMCMASFEAEWATFTHYCAAIGAHQKAGAHPSHTHAHPARAYLVRNHRYDSVLLVALWLEANQVLPTLVPVTRLVHVHGQGAAQDSGHEAWAAALQSRAEVVLTLQSFQQIADIHGRVVLVRCCGRALPTSASGMQQALLFRSSDMGAVWIHGMSAKHLL